MRPHHRKGFTWIELVVVLLVLALLLMLVPVFLLDQRVAARIATCRNRLRGLALACVQFEAPREHYPGYKNKLADNPASWVTMLLPYLEYNDLYEQFKQGNTKGQFIEMLICPDNPPQSVKPGDAPLAYVANGGVAGREDPAEGIFFDLTRPDPVYVSQEFIYKHDGTSRTLMLSEHLKMGNWTDTVPQSLTFNWLPAPPKSASVTQHISSRHRFASQGGGANVAFCDTHVEFMSADVDYVVYQNLMTPWSEEAGVP